MLLVVLDDAAKEQRLEDLESSFHNLASSTMIERRFVLARVPISTAVKIDGQHMRLVDHPSFAELDDSAGLVIIDVSRPENNHYGQVVSVYTFPSAGSIPHEHLAALLQLPEGSLTQRTLIFAVRTHPDRPRSTEGELASALADEAESHSLHQARVHASGHHNWDARFHRINGKIPGNLLAQEVCAESWPGQGLVAAAVECVRSWRQSDGHWEAVRQPHAYYGYDMKRGSDGVWYATGIFAREDF